MSMLDKLKDNEFSNHIGLEFLELNKETAVAKIPFSDKLCNPYGSIHGGVLYSFADIVCGTLACTCGNYCTTVDGNMQYILPAVNTEYILCEARIIKSGTHMVYVSAEIKTAEGNLIDAASFTFYKTNVPAETN